MKNSMLISLFVVLLTLPAAADKFTVGSKMEAFSAKDQHGAAYSFDPKTKFLLLTVDMATGKKANAALDAKGADYLPSKRAVFMANIHGMPPFGRVFALRKMKKYSHRIVLMDDWEFTNRFGRKDEQVTVFALDGSGKIRSIKFWTPGAGDLDALLK